LSKLKLIAILLVVAATAATPAAGAVGDDGLRPISAEAYVADLVDAGYRNGDMPSLRMIDVGGCLLERDAAYTLSLLLEAARSEGIDLVAQECYRSFGVQSAAYDRRCPIVEEEVVEVDPDTGEETVVRVDRARSCSGPPIARPGRSNHGWGRAVDFGNGRRVISCGDSAFVWLNENAGRFGWVSPDWAHCGRATREPWHWEWGGLTESLPLPLPEARRLSSGDIRVR
jgi:D-alanyl-D-alanine dipeptidase